MTENIISDLEPRDRPLRRDIRLLGWQFRRLVQNHGGDEVWETLNHLRDLAERRRAGQTGTEEAIVAMLASLPVDRLASLTRATGLFFDLANLAEDRHRVRVLRMREAAGRESETISQGIAEIRRRSSPAEFQSLLNRLQVEPVFTAHPTEAKRRTVRRVLRRLRQDLYLVDRPDQLPAELRQRLLRMQRDLLALWSTDPVSPRKPTVMEELRRTIYVVGTLWRVGPQIVRKLRTALSEEEGRDGLVRPLQFGNWIGGDRDGNPFVTTQVTRATLAKLRTSAIALHRRACRSIRQQLTISAARCPLPASLKADIDQAVSRWPRLARHLSTLHPDEWIVHWLTIVEQRLRRSAKLPGEGMHPMAYANTEALAADIRRVGDALREAGNGELAKGALKRWEDQIGIFGLHLLRLDIRVNSTMIRAATDQLLRASGQRNDYGILTEEDRRAALRQADAQRAADAPMAGIEEESADVLRVLGLAQQLAHHGAAEAIGQFIVSMTHKPSDILALDWLMQVAAHQARCPEAGSPLVPLFETIEDLKTADGLLEALLKDEAFQRRLSRGGNQLTCMIGYSDSAKDGGYLASNWALFDAQRRLAACAGRYGVALTIFHGRGGAIGRGGGPAARAITSLPREAVDGRLRVTEQGEVIAERYDDPAIALRHLEQLFWATLRQSIPRQEDVTPPDAEAFARNLSELSMKAYRGFVESPGFERFLRNCTALSLIEKLPIGSRPSRRTAAARLEDLRAIPFTFAWNQVRMPINAFYGLGAAFEALDEAGRRRATELYRQWPWFRAVINNAELAMARCDTAIARRYAMRAPDREEAMELWGKLRDEHDASLRAVLAIKQESSIIEKVPWLNRTIRVRNPYLDMLNLIQLELMSRQNSPVEGQSPQEIEAALRLTVQSIAAGLRNTG